ncbi:MAG: alpha-L-fucosidase, partial [Clostridiales bacterium]|nr:alpha-L-fucosidase [Clostridiales bacterium]
MRYEPTYESVRQHRTPQWFMDAKFGIFIHWSLFSVPAFAAEQTRDISESMAEDPAATFANNPYAEWYLNSLRIPGSPTQAFHRKHYGDKSYFDFQRDFEEQNASLDVNTWADLIARAGARYCVLVTKHHDGYTLWPTDTPNPHIPNYFSRRDFVGELTDAMRARGLKMGLYYSGVFDWTFKTDRPIDNMQGFLAHQDMPDGYAAYSLAHLRELIDKYRPSVLWNDIAFPYGYNLNELFAYYYNTVEDGAIDDRWNQIEVPKTDEGWAALAAA